MTKDSVTVSVDAVVYYLIIYRELDLKYIGYHLRSYILFYFLNCFCFIETAIQNKSLMATICENQFLLQLPTHHIHYYQRFSRYACKIWNHKISAILPYLSLEEISKNKFDQSLLAIWMTFKQQINTYSYYVYYIFLKINLNIDISFFTDPKDFFRVLMRTDLLCPSYKKLMPIILCP